MDSLGALVSILAGGGLATAVAEAVWKLMRARLIEIGVGQVPEALPPGIDLTDVERAIAASSTQLSERDAMQIAIAAIASGKGAGEAMRKEYLRQARLAFNAALALGIIGTLIIFAGVAIGIQSSETIGLVTGGAGVISNILSLVLFKLNYDANMRLSTIADSLNAIDSASVGLAIIEKMEDNKSRDKALADLVLSIRGSRPGK